MKPALFYAITLPFGTQIVAVTTVIDRQRGSQWHGRYVSDNSSTHGRLDIIAGRFDTEELARAVQRSIQQIVERLSGQREELQRAMTALHRSERAEIDEVIKAASNV